MVQPGRHGFKWPATLLDIGRRISAKIMTPSRRRPLQRSIRGRSAANAMADSNHGQIKGSALQGAAPVSVGRDADEQRAIAGFWRRILSNPWTIAIVGGATAAIIAGLVLTHISTNASTDPSNKTGINLTIENDRSYGVWSRFAPNGQFSTQNRQPPDTRQWLSQGASVPAVCARPAASYHVIVNGISTIWSWWIKLRNGQWIQSAAVAQTDTTGDGPVPGLPRC
jgi:hypothetical protein